MSKQSIKKATFKDLVAKAIQREQNKTKVKDIPVKSMDRSLTFVKPSENKIIDLMDELENKNSMRDQIEYMRKLIYFSCPMLQDPELHKELGVNEPFEVVEKLFDIADTNEIGEQLIELIGLNDVDNQIKN